MAISIIMEITYHPKFNTNFYVFTDCSECLVGAVQDDKHHDDKQKLALTDGPTCRQT